MKNIYLIILCILSQTFVSNAQMGINSTGAAPNTSAMLDVSSTTKGLLPPRMTSAQKTAIASPADGLLVFDTNTQSYWFRQSGTWTELPKAGSTSNYWSLSGSGGNEIQNTNSGGFWSANPVGLDYYSDDVSNPPSAPVNGTGTRMMWIPSRSAFRVGTITTDRTDAWDAANIGMYSVASGVNTKATGKASNASGYMTIASGDISIAMGKFTRALAIASTAMGYSTLASGFESVAMGYGTISSGDNCLATGGNTVASGWNATAMGYSSTSSGSQSVAMGYGTTSSGINTTAMGDHTKAVGENSLTTGYYNETYGNNSLAIGEGTVANSKNTLAMGTYNEDPFLKNSNDVYRCLFTIGNGSDINNRRNCFEVRQTGTVQINHYSPSVDNPDRYGLRIRRDIGARSQFWTISHPGSENLDFHYGASGAYKAYVRQTDGAWVQSSDIRLKEQIKPVESVLEKVAKLKVSRYFYKTDSLHTNQQMGLIAQEVLPFFPEFVTQNGQYYGVNYGGLSVVAIKAIQELKEENEALKTTLSSIKIERDELKKIQLEIEQIKAQLAPKIK